MSNNPRRSDYSRLSSVLSRGVEKGVPQQREVLSLTFVVLWMPLHSEGPVGAVLHCLHDAVRSSGRDSKGWRDVPNGLVVAGPYCPIAAPEQLFDPRTGLESYEFFDEESVIAAPSMKLSGVIQIGDQTSTECDVQQLCTAAHGEHRYITFQGPPQDVDGEKVGSGVYSELARHRTKNSVKLGIDVATTQHQDSVPEALTWWRKCRGRVDELPVSLASRQPSQARTDGSTHEVCGLARHVWEVQRDQHVDQGSGTSSAHVRQNIGTSQKCAVCCE